MLPINLVFNYFIIIGPQKSGTITLHQLLAEHLKIGGLLPKESNFFLHTDQGPHDYLDCFPKHQGKLWLGDSSPIYMLRSKQVAPQLAKILPKVKLIACLRNPITRAYSQFQMLLQIGKAKGSFTAALEEAQRVQSVDEIAFDPVSGYPVNPIQTLLLYGQHCRQLDYFRQFFHDDQLLIIRHEDLNDKHTSALERIFIFLHIKPFSIQPKHIHKRNYPPLPRPTWEQLQTILQCEIDSLEQMMGWDLKAWRKPPSFIGSEPANT